MPSIHCLCERFREFSELEEASTKTNMETTLQTALVGHGVKHRSNLI